MTQFRAYYESPVGLVEVSGTETAVQTLYFVDAPADDAISHPILDEAIRQLAQYFGKERRDFDLPLAPSGTPFQQSVWSELLSIPYGRVLSYMDIANTLEKPKAVRAVGSANGRNPISVIIPCHRVIGSNSKLTGYGGGLWRKEWLLRHEGSLLV
ncbi:MAG: methylated-DNA--[protein]-cysteine S-methyltransferase [Chloroflexota bacterium]